MLSDLRRCCGLCGAGAAGPCLRRAGAGPWLSAGAPSGDPGARERIAAALAAAAPDTPEAELALLASLLAVPKAPPATWRALVTVYQADTNEGTTDEQLRANPASLFVRDFSWSRVQ